MESREMDLINWKRRKQETEREREREKGKEEARRILRDSYNATKCCCIVCKQ